MFQELDESAILRPTVALGVTPTQNRSQTWG